MTTIAPMTPKNSQPTTDPMIHAAFSRAEGRGVNASPCR
jgi:hypothetical protein